MLTYMAKERKGRSDQEEVIPPDLFEAARADMKRVAPGGLRTTIDDTLINDVVSAFADGVWPREMPGRVGVGQKRWATWLARGAEQWANDEQTPEARLYGVVLRCRHRLELGYRTSLERLASAGRNWQAAAWLLARLSPGTYSEKVDETVEQELRALLKVAAETLGPGDFDKLALALENARNNRGGA